MVIGTCMVGSWTNNSPKPKSVKQETVMQTAAPTQPEEQRADDIESILKDHARILGEEPLGASIVED